MAILIGFNIFFWNLIFVFFLVFLGGVGWAGGGGVRSVICPNVKMLVKDFSKFTNYGHSILK